MRFGIDLGGTKIEIAALDDAGRIALRRRLPSPAGGYDETLATIARLVHEAERELGEQGSVGVAHPGAVSPATGRIKNANSTWLIGRPFVEDLQRVLGREVRTANDANCFALSEAVDGAGEGAPTVFGVILGTGAGSGFVVNGEVLTGANAIAGEWGHNPLPGMDERDPFPRKCYCGHVGCIETWLSGTGLGRDHAAHTGVALTGAQVAAGAEAGDAACIASLERYEERLARSLASVMNLLDPHVIVLGGGVSQVKRLYENVPRLWGRYVFSDDIRTRLVPPVHGDSSGVRGAAWLWNDRES